MATQTVSAATDKARKTPAATKKTSPPKKTPATPNATPPTQTDTADLLALATKIAKATRIKDATVEVVQGGKAAVIVYDGRKLAYVRGRPDRIALVVCHYGAEDRASHETVAAAAAAVKTSARRKPKAKAAS